MKCSMCRTSLNKKPSAEVFAEDSGIIRNFCGKCIHKMYNKLLLKPIKNREEINLMVWFDKFLKRHKIMIES